MPSPQVLPWDGQIECQAEGSRALGCPTMNQGSPVTKAQQSGEAPLGPTASQVRKSHYRRSPWSLLLRQLAWLAQGCGQGIPTPEGHQLGQPVLPSLPRGPGGGLPSTSATGVHSMQGPRHGLSLTTAGRAPYTTAEDGSTGSQRQPQAPAGEWGGAGAMALCSGSQDTMDIHSHQHRLGEREVVGSTALTADTP